MKLYRVKVNGKVYEVEVESVSEVSDEVKAESQKEKQFSDSSEKKILTAPIGGRVSDVMVQKGQMVHKGDPVMIIEAMKLENEIRSPYDGKIISIAVDKGSDVKNKDILMVLE